MPKKISIQLNKRSIQNAIDELQKYQQDFQRKNQIFVERLSAEGINVIHATMRNVDLGEDEWNYSAESITESTGTTAKEKIVLSGKRILYIEFGAGVIHSQPQNPKAKELGYGVGTNSPKGWAWNTTLFGGGWYYTSERNGKSIHTEGNPAYMPMYLASVEIRQKIREIAHEVFGG